MRRARSAEIDEAGQDSFLDVVANTVGILILLVMVVSVRASHRPQEEAKPAPPQPRAPQVTEEQVEQEAQKALQTRQRIIDLQVRLALARREVAQLDADRVTLAAIVAATEDEIEERKEGLSEEEQRDFELAQRAAELEAELEKLMREQMALASTEAAPDVVESLPTPLAKRVTGEEAFIHLSGGMAAYVPREELMSALSDAVDQNMNRFDDRDEVMLPVGPIDGFRMVFLARKYTVLLPNNGYMSRLGLVRYELQPNSDHLGEPVSEAIRPNSKLMRRLAQFPPKATTITIWVYPDSFEGFRKLKRALYKQGYAVAGRPLPHGVRIGGAPNGTATSVQ